MRHEAGGGRKAVSSYKNKASECINCIFGGGLCSWSQRMEPVPGSKVELITLRTQCNGKSQHEVINKVVYCPRHEPRRNTGNWNIKQ